MSAASRPFLDNMLLIGLNFYHFKPIIKKDFGHFAAFDLMISKVAPQFQDPGYMPNLPNDYKCTDLLGIFSPPPVHGSGARIVAHNARYLFKMSPPQEKILPTPMVAISYNIHLCGHLWPYHKIYLGSRIYTIRTELTTRLFAKEGHQYLLFSF